MTASVTGYSIIQGLSSTLDTMLPSAWTSPKPQLVGLWSQRMGKERNVPLLRLCLLTFFFWFFHARHCDGRLSGSASYRRFNSCGIIQPMTIPADLIPVVQRGVNITLFAPAARCRSPGCCVSQVLFHWSPCICVQLCLSVSLTHMVYRHSYALQVAISNPKVFSRFQLRSSLSLPHSTQFLTIFSVSNITLYDLSQLTFATSVWGPEPIALGFVGAPLATAISFNLIAIASIVYGIYFVPSTAWHPFSRRSFTNLGVLVRLGLGGVGMSPTTPQSHTIDILQAKLHLNGGPGNLLGVSDYHYAQLTLTNGAQWPQACKFQAHQLTEATNVGLASGLLYLQHSLYC